MPAASCLYTPASYFCISLMITYLASYLCHYCQCSSCSVLFFLAVSQLRYLMLSQVHTNPHLQPAVDSNHSSGTLFRMRDVHKANLWSMMENFLQQII